MSSFALRVVIAAMAALIAGCSSSPESRPAAAEPTPAVDPSTTAPTPHPSSIVRLGDFPEFPRGTLPKSVADSLQAVLDEAVEQGAFRGVTAAVIVADSGSWSGAAGIDIKVNRLTADSQLPIASVGKTVTAAQILRLVEEGKLGLDDPAADHLPREVAFFDANGATIRDVLGMRSGIPDYTTLVDQGSTPAKLLKTISEHPPPPLFPAGSEISYANINYILLGMIIEHVTGRPLWEVLRSDVLDRPGLDGLVYREKGALAADGGWIESDPASLARWGYELYGGFVLSDASLRQMTDFQGYEECFEIEEGLGLGGYQGCWYGLGAIDFSQVFPAIHGVPAIGHGGLEPSIAIHLTAFPQTDVVVAVQAHGGTLTQVATVGEALRVAAQP